MSENEKGNIDYIANLRLHESVYISNELLHITKVFNGYIYRTWCNQKNDFIDSGVFVPGYINQNIN